MKKILLIFSLFVFVSSCKTTKDTGITSKINPSIKSKKLEKIIHQNDFDINYFSSKIRVLYNKQSFTANLRMKKGEVIWLSLTGPFGIEGARVKITKDQFQMINRLNGTYYNEPLSFVEKFLPLKVDFAMLENLLLGNFIEKDIKKQKIETKDQNYIVKGDVDGFEILYYLLANGKLEKIAIDNQTETQNIDVDYKKYEKFDNQEFSVRREFLIKDNLDRNFIDLKFYKMNTSEVSFPFKVPSSYMK